MVIVRAPVHNYRVGDTRSFICYLCLDANQLESLRLHLYFIRSSHVPLFGRLSLTINPDKSFHLLRCVCGRGHPRGRRQVPRRASTEYGAGLLRSTTKRGQRSTGQPSPTTTSRGSTARSWGATTDLLCSPCKSATGSMLVLDCKTTNH